jgi:hypothetical protein
MDQKSGVSQQDDENCKILSGRVLGEKVGNLKEGGRLGRVKPISSRIKPLRGTTAQHSELLRGKPGRGKGPERPWCEESEFLGEAKTQESNVLLLALIQLWGVTDLQSAEGLEAGHRNRRANGKKAWGPEKKPRLVVGNNALKGEPHGRYQLKQCWKASGEGKR